jgi:hypothetical protein
MKFIIASILGLAGFGLLSSCTFVGSRPPATQTTTTAEIIPSTYGTVETKTTRTY